MTAQSSLLTRLFTRTLPRLVARSLHLEPREAKPVMVGFVMQFTLFACYFSMRPIRETMGVVGAGLHAEDEYIELSSIAPRLYLTVAMIRELSR